jgi:hypothetical protein
LENILLYSQLEYDQSIPISFKLIQKSIKYFDKTYGYEKNRNFCKNMIIYFKFISDKFKNDKEILIYWFNVLLRMFNCLKEENKEIDSSIKSFLKQDIMIERKLGLYIPIFKYDDYNTNESNNKSKEEFVNDFFNELCNLINIFYFNLLDVLLNEIKKILMNSLFNKKILK